MGTIAKIILGLGIVVGVAGCSEINPDFFPVDTVGDDGSMTTSPGATTVEPRDQTPTSSGSAADGSSGTSQTSTTSGNCDPSNVDHGTGGSPCSGEAGGSQGSAGGPICRVGLPPTATQCPPVCNGGCDTGVCSILCFGQSCAGTSTLQCPPGWPCEITCANAFGCRETDFLCPQDHDCTLACVGISTCTLSRLHCANAPCALTCAGVAGVCDTTELMCGSTDSVATCIGSAQPVVVPSGSECACLAIGCEP